jgi:Domain of unknown function (DUF3597)
MSIFGNIMGAIFGHRASGSASPAPSGSAGAAPSQPGSTARPGTPAGASPGQAGAAVQPSPPLQPVDVEAVLRDLASKKREQLNWRQSIVDLMKVLDLDSSLAARKELAKELHYTGALDGSAEMNIWLHKQVMTKLAENGGKVPADLRHSA